FSLVPSQNRSSKTLTVPSTPASLETAALLSPATSPQESPLIPRKYCAPSPSRSPANTSRVPASSFRGTKAACCGLVKPNSSKQPQLQAKSQCACALNSL